MDKKQRRRNQRMHLAVLGEVVEMLRVSVAGWRETPGKTKEDILKELEECVSSFEETFGKKRG